MSAPAPVSLLIPVKAFTRAKFRLAPDIDPDRRQHLAREMATHVVHAAGEMPVAVVCDDDEVAEWVASVGAQLIWTPGTGLNGAVAAGVDALRAQGTRHVVVAHSDLPLADDLDQLGGWPGVTIVPDRHRGGSNVLALPTDCGFQFAYGTGSYARHREEAVRIGRGLRIVHRVRLGWDVDFPDDLQFPPELQAVSALNR